MTTATIDIGTGFETTPKIYPLLAWFIRLWRGSSAYGVACYTPKPDLFGKNNSTAGSVHNECSRYDQWCYRKLHQFSSEQEKVFPKIKNPYSSDRE